MPTAPGRVIRVTPAYALFADVGSTWAAVEGIRLRDARGAEVALAAVDAFLAETDTLIASWWLTERSTPDGLEELLLALGVERREEDYLHACMLLTSPPPAAGVEARAVRSAEEYVEAWRLQGDVFASPEARPKSDAELAAEYRRTPDVLFAAWVDGRMAAAGRATFASCGVYLFGGATAPWARGRGAYRAVVRARWEAAVARGTPALAVGAGPMSRPILERLGFRQVLQYRRLQSVRSPG